MKPQNQQLMLQKYRSISKTVWLQLAATLLNSAGTALLFYYAIYFSKNLNMHASTIGVIMGCFGVGSVFGSYFIGKLGDKFTTNILSFTLLLLQTFIIFAICFSRQYIYLSTEMFLLGCFNYGFIVSNRLAILSDPCCQNFSFEALGLRSMFSNTGLGIALSLGAVFIGSLGYLAFFSTVAMLLCIMALVLLISNHKATVLPRIENALPGKTSTHKTNHYNAIIFAIIAMFLVGIIISQVRLTYPLYLHNYYNTNSSELSILFLVNVILVVALQMFVTHVSSNFNKILLSGIGAFIIGIGFYILIFFSTFYMAIISCIIWTLGEVIFFNAIRASLYENATKGKKGHYLGIQQMFWAVSHIIGPTVGGYMYHYYPAKYIWYICGIIGVVALVYSLNIVLIHKSKPFSSDLQPKS